LLRLLGSLNSSDTWALMLILLYEVLRQSWSRLLKNPSTWALVYLMPVG